MAAIKFTVEPVNKDAKIRIHAEWIDQHITNKMTEGRIAEGKIPMPIYDEDTGEFEKIPDDLDHKTIRVSGEFLYDLREAIGVYDIESKTLTIGEWTLNRLSYLPRENHYLFEQSTDDFKRQIVYETTFDQWNSD